LKLHHYPKFGGVAFPLLQLWAGSQDLARDPAKLDSPIMSSNSQFGLQHETGLQPAASEKKGSSEA